MSSSNSSSVSSVGDDCDFFVNDTKVGIGTGPPRTLPPMRTMRTSPTGVSNATVLRQRGVANVPQRPPRAPVRVRSMVPNDNDLEQPTIQHLDDNDEDETSGMLSVVGLDRDKKNDSSSNDGGKVLAEEEEEEEQASGVQLEDTGYNDPAYIMAAGSKGRVGGLLCGIVCFSMLSVVALAIIVAGLYQKSKTFDRLTERVFIYMDKFEESKLLEMLKDVRVRYEEKWSGSIDKLMDTGGDAADLGKDLVADARAADLPGEIVRISLFANSTMHKLNEALHKFLYSPLIGGGNR